MSKIIVIDPGPLSTVQDLGRFCFQRYGIPQAGAMDEFALEIANLLVGNERNEGAIEITSSGFKATFEGNANIAITGGDLGATLNDEEIESWQSFLVSSGNTIKFNRIKKGFRAYLSISGGISVEKVLKSKSTCLAGKFGGFGGRKLRSNDVLSCGGVFNKVKPTKIDVAHFQDYHRKRIRVILGPQKEYFSDGEIDEFFKASYILTINSDRMGYRLAGPELFKESSTELLSEGVATGSIQISGDGLPIVMMVDHQTTGGYPKIANVISIDLPTLAQFKAGDELSFEPVSLDLAKKLYIERETKIKDLEYDLLDSKSKIYRVLVDGKNFDVEIKEKE
jgi:biotin-dependent carboxylase-like uncharacterized protein